MNEDSFTNKEMLQQLMVDIRTLRDVMSEHRELITRQSALNQGRDNEIANMAAAMKEVGVEMKRMRVDFDEKMMTIQSASQERINEIEEKTTKIEQKQKFFEYRVMLIVGVATTIGAFLLSFFIEFVKSFYS